jgi:hypothetical protein
VKQIAQEIYKNNTPAPLDQCLAQTTSAFDQILEIFTNNGVTFPDTPLRPKNLQILDFMYHRGYILLFTPVEISKNQYVVNFTVYKI